MAPTPYHRMMVFAADERCAGTVHVIRLGKKKKEEEIKMHKHDLALRTVSGRFVNMPSLKLEVEGDKRR